MSTGKALAFDKGEITLRKLGGSERTYWQCVQNKGWLGFRDPSSCDFLGYNRDKNETLCLSAKVQNVWENFCVRQRPGGDYVLLMEHYEGWWNAAWKELRPVGIVVVDGKERLAAITDWGSESIGWTFTKVADSQEGDN